MPSLETSTDIWRAAAVASAALLLSASTGLAQAKSYRYQTEEGQTTYSDRLPPTQSGGQRRVLDNRGLTVERVGPAKTRAEIEREKELRSLRKEQEAIVARQQQADRNLLRTYATEQDVLRARDSKLDAVDVTDKRLRTGIKRLEGKRQQHISQAAGYERRGLTVPNELIESIRRAEQAIVDNHRQLAALNKDRQRIRDHAEKDLLRYRELTAMAQSQQRGSALHATGGDKVRPEIVPCASEQSCAKAWGQAMAFVRAHATVGLQTWSDKVILTQPPVDERDLGMVVTRLGEGYPGRIFLDVRCVNSRAGRELCSSAAVNALRDKFRQQVGAR